MTMSCVSGIPQNISLVKELGYFQVLVHQSSRTNLVFFGVNKKNLEEYTHGITKHGTGIWYHGVLNTGKVEGETMNEMDPRQRIGGRHGRYHAV